jgi:hypothetical protein
MTVGPSTNSTNCNREKAFQAWCNEAPLKQLEAAICASDILEKALDVLRKRIASGEISDNMLLRVIVSLAKV